MIPTVRVANPATDGFKTINAEDYDPATHGDLWPEQHPSFTGLPEKRVGEVRLDPAVRDKAAALFVAVMDLRASSERKPLFASLSPEAQMTALRDAEQEITDQRQRKAEYEANWQREAETVRKAIAEKDTEQADAAALAQQAADTAQQAADKLTDDGAGKAPEAAAQATPGNPFATGTNPAPAPNADEALGVSQGPGRKWFVMRGTTPVTEGFATKAEAEGAKTKLEAA